MLVWLAMTTGARRGELCAQRWPDIDFTTALLAVGSSIGQLATRVWEKDTKTHQRRRIVLAAQTLALLRAYPTHRAQRAAQLGVALAEDAFVFSPLPDGSAPIRPDTVTQLGRGFTLVRTDGDPTAFTDAAARLGIPLTVLDLDEPLVPSEPRGLVLVRPDMFVGWSGDAVPVDVDDLFRTLVGVGSVDARLSAAAS